MTSVNPLTSAIAEGAPLLVLSPHLDDAILSCGAIMLYAMPRTEVSVLTLFTEAGPPPHTLSARQFLRQVGARSAQELYRERREEDREVLEKMGVTCVHAGLTEALFRKRPGRREYRLLGRMLPELAHLYPVYRWQITAGRIAPGDAGTLRAARAIIQRLARPGTMLVSPLGVGGHVDHLLTRTAVDQSGIPAVYYSDFPHNQRHAADPVYIEENSLVAARWTELLEAKAELIRGYRTQVNALFPDGRIPLVPEVYMFPWVPGGPVREDSG